MSEPLPWTTPQELRDFTPPEPDFIVRGFWVRGAITDLPAKIKAGKTTFITRMIRSAVHGVPFLEQESKPSRLLFLTEEREATIRAALDRAGLLDVDETYFKILHRHKVLKLSWPEVMLAAAEECLRGDYTGLVIDTLSRWAKIEGEHQEQDSGIAAQAVAPLEAVAAAGIGIIMARHDNKGEGSNDPSDSGRGSSAFGGAADIILNLKKANQNGHPNRRVLHIATRFGDLPDEIYGDLSDDGYARVAEGLEAREAYTLALGYLVAGPKSLTELTDLTGHAKQTLRDGLNQGVQHGEIIILPPTPGARGRPQNVYSLPPH